MPVTIHDLARLSGLNASTISRALRSDPRVRESTREMIRKLAREHGYVPNLAARQLAAGRSGNVFFCFGSPQAAIELETAIALNDLLGAEYDLLLALHGNSPKRLKRLLEKLYQKAADGALIIPPGNTDQCVRELTGLVNGLPVPHIFVDRYWEGLDCPVVTTDNAMGARELVRQCYERGAREFLVSFAHDNEITRWREAAAIEEIRRRKLTLVEKVEAGERTALIANSPLHSVAVDVPLLCGGFFDSMEPAAQKQFKYAVICRQNFPAIAARAAQLLTALMKGRKAAKMSKIPPLDYPVFEN